MGGLLLRGCVKTFRPRLWHQLGIRQRLSQTQCCQNSARPRRNQRNARGVPGPAHLPIDGWAIAPLRLRRPNPPPRFTASPPRLLSLKLHSIQARNAYTPHLHHAVPGQ